MMGELWTNVPYVTMTTSRSAPGGATKATNSPAGPPSRRVIASLMFPAGILVVIVGHGIGP